MIINCRKDSLKQVPSTIGIYIFYNKKEILYIGKSINLKARVISHFENAKLDAKEAAIINNSQKIKLIPIESEFKALLLESSYIQKYEPKYNRIWRDDKSYLYIKINIKDKYPTLMPVRRENDGVSKYFGPYHSTRVVHALLRDVRRNFPFCTQNKIGNRPCFYSKINLCKPCPSAIENTKDEKEKKILTAIYRLNIRQIIKIFEGKVDLLLKSYYKDLKSQVKQEKYEQALITRNRIFGLERLITERLFLDHDLLSPVSLASANNALIEILKKYFAEINNIARVECYDISNIGGKYATGSMVVVVDGLIAKKEYRKFKIRQIKADYSDFDMLSEVINRRFKNSWTRPDLIVVDGGRPQVKAVLQTLKKINVQIPLIGIAKNPDRLVIGSKDLETVKVSHNNLGFNMIRLIRDESHRFAKKYHLFLRDRKLV